MIFDFVPLWTLILGLAVFFYVLLDGFDLGVGILYNFAPNTPARNLLMNSIAPIWDGNETWLVLGGIGLLAAFPLAFAIILPAVYFPILVMLLALVFRGVAFEFRFRDAEHRTFWDHAFGYGSALATFAQGVVLGAFIQGFEVEGRHFTGGSFDCITPFSLFVGVALLFGYSLLGAGWLILKTEGNLQTQARNQARTCFLGTLAAVGIVSIWTPLVDGGIAQRWFSWPNIAFLSPVPVLTALFGILEWRAIADRKSELGPFIYAVLLFCLSYLGIAISLFPMIVPHHYDLWQAASSPDTQIFLGVGTLFLLPVILVYTGWSYWVFRGKVRADTGYHYLMMKTVLVTGAAKRLGRAIALDLAAQGWNVAIHYNSSEDDADSAAQAVRAFGAEAATLKCDLSKEAETAKLVDRAVKELGPLTALINSASLFENDDWQSASRKSWDDHIETNLRAPLLLSQLFAKQLPDGAKGNIINIIDQRVLKPTPQFLSYSVSKAGLYWLTTTLAQGMGPRIRVNAVGPGPTLKNPRQSDGDFNRQRDATILGRGADPADICAAVRYLLEAEAVTGQMLAVDGGQHLIWQTPDVQGGE